MPELAGFGAYSFDLMGDEEVVGYAKRGSQTATEHLLKRYRNLVEGKARAYFLVGADHEDVVQEGMIGLFKAIRDFKRDRLSAFRSFAELCVTRQIITAVKTATRQKHALLNTYVSLDTPLHEDPSERTLLDALSRPCPADPERVVMSEQFQAVLRHRIRRDLSELEACALLAYAQGKSYHEIAAELGRDVKQIDNALQRAKKKISRNLRPSTRYG
jgi:RNA polymerase sporulation-specific sigma factor